jgi:thioredoxin reductase
LSAEPEVVIVGGGPAGLAAAAELGRQGVRDVLVIERETQAGGIPRHAKHQGFGLRDLHRVMSGPDYAARLRGLALSGGAATLMAETMVTGWSPGGPLELTGPGGRITLEPPAVILATGCRERPRSARLVPGSRPDGVMTTGTLQQLVYLKKRRLGGRALVVGAEHVSFSALMTLDHGGARAVGMTTELPNHQSFALFRAGSRVRYRAPLWTRTAVTAIHGRPRVEEVELTDLDSGRVRALACDSVIFTADWIPDNELAVIGDLELDPGTRGPAVDARLRTSRRGVFAAGNLLHGAETADVAALSGRHAARAAARWLGSAREWPEPRLPLGCDAPLAWISPNVVSPTDEDPADAPPRGRFALRSTEFLTRPRLEVMQAGRKLWSGRVARIVPGRSVRLPHGWSVGADPSGGPLTVSAFRSPASG